MTTVIPIPTKTLAWLKPIVFITGLFYTLTGLSMLIAPVWFYQSIGHFPPFNRHYMGDVATFILPLGCGLILAAQNPWRYRLLLWVAASASLLHGFNHLYDAVAGQMSLTHWLTDTIPLLAGAILLIAAIWPLSNGSPD